jgi:hypothetical protein
MIIMPRLLGLRDRLIKMMAAASKIAASAFLVLEYWS